MYDDVLAESTNRYTHHCMQICATITYTYICPAMATIVHVLSLLAYSVESTGYLLIVFCRYHYCYKALVLSLLLLVLQNNKRCAALVISSNTYNLQYHLYQLFIALQ
jgi:hypothetical protein